MNCDYTYDNKKYSDIINNCKVSVLKELHEHLDGCFEKNFKPFTETVGEINDNLDLIKCINSLIHCFPEYKNMEKKYLEILEENKNLKEQLHNQNKIKLCINDINTCNTNTNKNDTNSNNINAENIKLELNKNPVDNYANNNNWEDDYEDDDDEDEDEDEDEADKDDEDTDDEDDEDDEDDKDNKDDKDDKDDEEDEDTDDEDEDKDDEDEDTDDEGGDDKDDEDDDKEETDEDDKDEEQGTQEAVHAVVVCSWCKQPMGLAARHIDWDLLGFNSQCDNCCCGSCGSRKKYEGHDCCGYHSDEDADEEEGKEACAEDKDEESSNEEFSDDEEVDIVKIAGKNYYTNNTFNGNIYLCLKNKDVGDKIGEFKNNMPIFH